MKYLQMPVNSSNLEKFPHFTPKGHPRVCWVIWITLQLQRTKIENDMIDTIDTIDKINTIGRISFNSQYKDNRYNKYDQLTL